MTDQDETYALASRFLGEIKEIGGEDDNPFIQWAFTSCHMSGETPDEVPWCSAFVNIIHWIRRLPRSASASARSWLSVGREIRLEDARDGDIVIVKSAPGDPGPDVKVAMRGHVGFFAGIHGDEVWILGGNQSNNVTLARFRITWILGVRRV